MRVMTIITAVWLLLMGLAAVSSHTILSLPAGEKWADVALGALAVNFVCWWLGVLGVPVVVIGWPVAIILKLTRARKRH